MSITFKIPNGSRSQLACFSTFVSLCANDAVHLHKTQSIKES